MKDLILSLKSANSERSKKRSEILKIGYYQKLLKFLESRFENGGIYVVKNYFTDYKLTVKDQEGNDKTVYGFIADNGKTYLGLNDIVFPKKLYKREIRKVNGEETTTYTQLGKKVYQGDLAILFDKFKSQYKDSLLAFDLLYLAIAKHNESKFVSELFIYPTETFQRFKGEFTTDNFYLFNLKTGGTSAERIAEIVADICADYDNSLNEEPAEVLTEDMNIISLREALESDIYIKKTHLVKEFELESKEVADIKPQKKRNGQHYGHEWVDLGLPSGVKWATCNVGASSPEEYGNYYAWGETSTNSEYVEGNCSTYGKSMGDISGDAQYDVVRKYWGGSWRMPTKTELQELEKNCSWIWTTQNDIKGCKVTGPNGNSIFLPAAGLRYRSSLYGAGGRYVRKWEYTIFSFNKLHTGRCDYWSSSPSDDKCDYFKNASAYYLTSRSGNHDTSTEFRYVGKSVRPVLETLE